MTLPSRSLTTPTRITRVFKLTTVKASLIVIIFQILMLLTSLEIIATEVQKIVLKTSYFGLTWPYMEKQSEYLVIGDRFATYGMGYSHEIRANF